MSSENTSIDIYPADKVHYCGKETVSTGKPCRAAARCYVAAERKYRTVGFDTEDKKSFNECRKMENDIRLKIVEKFGNRACKAHINQESDVLDLIDEIASTMYIVGYSEGCRITEECVDRNARQRAREEETLKNTRYRTTDGGQIVLLGRYSYVWYGDEPLAVGDTVIQPGNWLFSTPTEAVVTGLGSDYTCTMTTIHKLVKRAD